ncbi:sulfotransferase family protein [Alteromonas sp. D210916BOD_24]|uniref:hypothetical protein n=1 Tax=Alteromonas sp. D210916BOD_24 TaxID=3157618 RepID=UPI00399D202F
MDRMLTAKQYTNLIERPEAWALAETKISKIVEQICKDIVGSELSFNQLVSELAAWNDELSQPDISSLKKYWLPDNYSADKQSVRWCLALDELPFAPFYDERIAKLRGQHIFASIIKPQTPLSLLVDGESDNPVSGFIFHLSRCGSTLVSNCLTASPTHTVLSEAHFLTQLLLDNSLNDELKITVLQALMCSFGKKLIVKLNAWDLAFYTLLMKAFPETPVVIIIREPGEILVSHQKSAGIHMVPNGLTKVPPHWPEASNDSLNEYQAKVLSHLMGIAKQYVQSSRVKIVDYAQLPMAIENIISPHFGITLSASEIVHMKQLAKVYSKNTELQFKSDSKEKQQQFEQKFSADLKLSLLEMYQGLGVLAKQAAG